MQKRYHTLENIIFDAIVYLVMAFVLICCLVPFIYMLAVSFSGTKPLINGEVAAYRAVTTGDILAFSRRTFRPENCSILIYKAKK